MSVQAIRRALTLPPVASDAPPFFQAFVRGYIIQLAQQTNILQSHFQTFNASWGAVGLIALNLAVPFPTTDYGVYVSMNQNSGAYWITAKTVTGFTLNFGVAGAGSAAICAVSNS